MAESRMRAPAGLGPRGRASWRSITAIYQLRPDETELLAEFCRTLDLIEHLRKGLLGQPLTVDAVRDGIKAHPLLIELRSQREQARRLAAQLKLANIDAAFDGATIEPSGPWSSRSHRRETA